MAIAVDAGPAVLAATDSGNVNVPTVTVTICAPGTTTCQTIDHIIVDTGSVGLRIEHEVLTPDMLAALPKEMSGGNGVAECYQYVDGYVFGSVRKADFTIGGENVANMNMMVIADDGVYGTVPGSCSSSGGSEHDSVADFGANGIIGIGLGAIDCGSFCSTSSSTNDYYTCPTAGGCTSLHPANSLQVYNPVALMSGDNNGVIVDLPAAAGFGQSATTGTLTFGIGTRSNNQLTAANLLTTDDYGQITATYNGTALDKSFIDSGTNFYSFSDSAITQCTGAIKGFYCPTSTLSLSALLTGGNGHSATINFHVDNTTTIAATDFYVLPGLGGDPNAFDSLHPISDSFDVGLPFFYGRRVFVAIAGRNAGGTAGPYWAF